MLPRAISLLTYSVAPGQKIGHERTSTGTPL
jgi:hypothetical protein